MSNRYTIISAIGKFGIADYRQLCEEIQSISPKQISDTNKDCIKAGLVERTEDSVDGKTKVCYRLTSKGKEWLRTNEQVQASEPEQPAVEDSQVVVPPPPDYEPGSVCFDAKKREAAKDAEIEKLRSQLEFVESARITAESQRDAWRDMAATFGQETPLSLSLYITSLQQAADTAEMTLAMTVSGEQAQQPATALGYTVAKLESEGIIFADQEDAKHVAVIQTLSTKQKHTVFAVLNTVEAVAVEWAA